MALTPDGREIENRHRTRRPPWAAYATDHDPAKARAGCIQRPMRMIDAASKVVRTSRRILHKVGREPTPGELAEKLGMLLERMREVLKIAKKPLSLETLIDRRGRFAPGISFRAGPP
jgi:Sigma-70 region 3